MANRDPLEDWRMTTLGLRVGPFIGPKEEQTGPLVTLDVWYPPNISKNERMALLAKHASQGVTIIRQLTGTKEMIIQGQYKDATRLLEETR